MDDCLIYSETYEEHLEDVRTAFERLKGSNIQLRTDKCHLSYQEVNFLDHRISGGRSSWSRLRGSYSYFPAHLRARLQGFLWSINCYHSYLPGTNRTPLHRLTKKGAPWNWTNNCEAAFNKLRFKLLNELIALAFLTGIKIYEETGASKLVVAVVQSQKDRRTGILKPIQFFPPR